ncbi:PIN domain-containing protein [Deinococcus saxicola]
MLYVSLLRDLLLRLAVEGVCHVHWSAEVQGGWKQHLVDDAGYAEEVIARTQARMDAALPTAQITGYEKLIPALQLPDPADRHVLAAALQAQAEVLVTFNLKDFPPEVLAAHGLIPIHPDVLLPRL